MDGLEGRDTCLPHPEGFGTKPRYPRTYGYQTVLICISLNDVKVVRLDGEALPTVLDGQIGQMVEPTGIEPVTS